jgi:hypothetical protein
MGILLQISNGAGHQLTRKVKALDIACLNTTVFFTIAVTYITRK